MWHLAKSITFSDDQNFANFPSIALELKTRKTMTFRNANLLTEISATSRSHKFPKLQNFSNYLSKKSIFRDFDVRFFGGMGALLQKLFFVVTHID